MRVFVTGASGFIGSAVVKELLGAGHQVLGLARSEAAATKLAAAGAQVHRGNVEDVECLRRGAAECDGAIHTAFFHALSHMAFGTRLRVLFGGSPTGIVTRFVGAAVGTDRRAMETIGRALRGHDRPLVAAFGTMGMRAGQVATEDDTYDADGIGGGRARSEDTMQALAGEGIRTSIIRLPPIVHGAGDRAGFAPRLIATARKKRESAYIDDGRNRWPSVHVADAARLFRLALEKGTAGARYHGVAEEGLAFRSLAETIGQRVGVPVVSKPRALATKQFSFLGHFIPVDNPTSSKLTQDRLGWRPTNLPLLADLAEAHYYAT